MAITTAGHEKMKNWLHDIIKEGRYRIGSTNHTTPIFKTKREGDTITFYLYLADDVSGSINRFELIDKDGGVFDSQPDSVTKTELNGLLITFKYTLSRV